MDCTTLFKWITMEHVEMLNHVDENLTQKCRNTVYTYSAYRIVNPVRSGYRIYSLALQENAQSGQHVWFETSLSGDFCYVGELYCFAKSLVRFLQCTYAALPLLHLPFLIPFFCRAEKKNKNITNTNSFLTLLLRLK